MNTLIGLRGMDLVYVLQNKGKFIVKMEEWF